MNALDEGIRINIFYGSVKLESRMRPVGNRVIGEGRALHFDANGKLVKDTGWEPTGGILTWG